MRGGNSSYGGIAQLGERLNGIQEVSGSIPLISTRKHGNHVKEKASNRKIWGFFLAFYSFSEFPHFLPVLFVPERYQNEDLSFRYATGVNETAYHLLELARLKFRCVPEFAGTQHIFYVINVNERF